MLLTPTRSDASNVSIRFPVAALIVTLLLALAPFLIHFDTAHSVVSIWNSSETFAHGYIILPISLWLIWKRRESFTSMVPTPYWPALMALALCGFGWLLAELGDVQVVRQYTFVAMIPVAVLAVLGPSMTSTIAFPLLFLLLAVPFGDIFIAPLIDFTADFTVAALQATGIPVLGNGSTFSIPSGDWSVVEACSGVRYLISSFTLGSLYAYLTYRSRVRQLIFVLLSIIVPIIANGLRAYMIVMIGHLSGMKLAVGVDHLIYGWLFFGLVMFLMFRIGSFWREDQHQPAISTTIDDARQSNPIVPVTKLFAVALGAVVCIGIWPLYANYIKHTGFNPAPAKLSGFQTNWNETLSFTPWKPGFFPANTELHRFFQNDSHKVGVSVMHYRNQSHGFELISSANRLVQEHDPIFRNTDTSVRRETISNRALIVRESRIQGTAGPMLVGHWYWIDGKFTTNDYFGKLLQAKEKLLMHGDDGASLMVFAPYTGSSDEARSAMREFLASNSTALEATLDHNKKN